jgi:hypothetical protein
MEQSQIIDKAKAAPRFHWILMLCWALGLYLIATSVLTGVALWSNRSYLHGLMIMDDKFNIYPILALLLLKLVNGVLLFTRSRWVLLTIPTWIVALLFDLVVHDGWKQLHSDFLLAAALQGCILSFALWAHGRGYLKR